MADIKTIPVPVEVVDRISAIAKTLHDIANEFDDFVIINKQVEQQMTLFDKEPEKKVRRAPVSSMERWTIREARRVAQLKREGRKNNEISNILVAEGFPYRSVTAVRRFLWSLRNNK